MRVFDAQDRQATSCLHEMTFAGCKNMERVSAECSGACRVGTYSIAQYRLTRNTEIIMNCKREDFVLYAVTDRTWLGGESLYSQVEKALKGGATFIQLREKHMDEELFCEEAVEIHRLCQQYGVPFVINDNVDIVLKMNADGVHVGQNDMEAGNVREKLGPNKIIGVSAHSVQEALQAESRGADYLGVGAAFTTGSKADANVISHETIKAICEAVSIPVVAIGGISKDNVGKLAGTGVDGVAVISAIFAQNDIEAATKELKTITENALLN